jgi:mannose-1-phosphate guanylyltransferase
MQTSQSEICSVAAIILAGGKGTRLSSLTRKITGHDVPKQFCPLLGNETLLEQTRRRVALAIPPVHTLTVLTREHEPYYERLLDPSDPNLVIQPCSRGTAPAILYALLRLIKMGHRGAVAIFPSDHYVSHEQRFMLYVRAVSHSVLLHQAQIVLLGAKAEWPESQYGWIEPAFPIDFSNAEAGTLIPVRRFWEKPTPELASEFLRRGFLWNTSVIVATTAAFLELFARALPKLHTSLIRVLPLLDTPREQSAIESVYSGITSCGFSDSILSEFAEDLSVQPLSGLVWNDLGEPGRVFATISQLDFRPNWLI